MKLNDFEILVKLIVINISICICFTKISNDKSKISIFKKVF